MRFTSKREVGELRVTPATTGEPARFEWRYERNFEKKYAYVAAGQLEKEDDRMYQYGWLDNVTQITEGDKVIRSPRCRMDGQLAVTNDGSLGIVSGGRTCVDPA